MSKSSRKLRIDSRSEMLRHHGVIVLVLYYFTKFLSWLSIGHWFRSSPRIAGKPESAIDQTADKVSAWWQDGVSVLLLALTPFPILLAQNSQSCAACLGLFFSAYLIFDAVIYYIRVLWFDDIQPSIKGSRREVWSHRRILFLAVANYIQSIFLFAALYALTSEFTAATYSEMLQESFLTATLLGVDTPLSWVNVVQVGVSFFYLAVVIAITASISYRREEYRRPSTDTKPQSH